MNSKVLMVLAKQEVKWEAKFGRTLSLEDAIENQKQKIKRLEATNDYHY
jgi:hypothetical protein